MADLALSVAKLSHRDFLQTALFVDDRALVPDIDEIAEIVVPLDVDGALDPDDGLDPLEIGEVASALAVDDVQDVVRTNELVEALADFGVTCSVLAPQSLDRRSVDRVTRLGRRTDLMILDWNLGRGSTSAELICSLVQQDAELGGRLRLIVVYTSEDRLAELASELGGLLSAMDGLTELDVDDVVVAGKHFRIVFVRKPVPGAHFAGMESGVAPADLAKRVLAEFDQLVGEGLLQQLAVRSLSEVRDHAHHLLSRFDSVLDPAFIGHRAQTSHRDAVLFSLELLGTELASLVRSSDISEMLSEEMVGARVDSLIQGRESARHWNAKKGSGLKDPVPIARVRKFLVDPSETTRSGIGVKSGDPSVSSLLLNDELSEEDLKRSVTSIEQRFTLLASLVRTSEHDQARLAGPVLELGVVVKDSRGQYKLCVQPLCDSVRVSSVTGKQFLFLPLEKSDSDLSCDLMVWDGAPVPLQVGSLGSSKEYKFLGDSVTRVVKSRLIEGQRVFTTAGRVKLQWVGTVRDAQVRRLVQRLAEHLTRVGLDEPHLMVRREAL